MFFIETKANTFLITCQISINASGKVSSFQLAGQGISFTDTSYETICWLDSVASEMFKVKVRFNFDFFFLLLYDCDFLILLMLLRVFISAPQEESIPCCTLRKEELRSVICLVPQCVSATASL